MYNIKETKVKPLHKDHPGVRVVVPTPRLPSKVLDEKNTNSLKTM